MGHRIHGNMLNHGSLFRVIKDFMVQGGDFLKVKQGMDWMVFKGSFIMWDEM